MVFNISTLYKSYLLRHSRLQFDLDPFISELEQVLQLSYDQHRMLGGVARGQCTTEHQVYLRHLTIFLIAMSVAD